MNSSKSSFAKFNSMALALLATTLLVSGAASAKEHKSKGSADQPKWSPTFPSVVYRRLTWQCRGG